MRILVGSGGGKRGRGREIAREKGVGEGERVGRKNMEEGGREGGREGEMAREKGVGARERGRGEEGGMGKWREGEKKGAREKTTNLTFLI